MTLAHQTIHFTRMRRRHESVPRTGRQRRSESWCEYARHHRRETYSLRRRWKIDFRVFPMMCIVFGLSLLDRTNISAAYIAGLAKDIKLAVGSRYSVALLVFFIGYCIFELPSNYIIRRIGARYWLSFLITAWGCCVLGMGFIHDWKILTVLRALLGIFEAGLFPGCVYIVSHDSIFISPSRPY